MRFVDAKVIPPRQRTPLAPIIPKEVLARIEPVGCAGGPEKTQPSSRVKERLGVEHGPNGASRLHEDGRPTCEPPDNPGVRYARPPRRPLGGYVPRQVLAELR